MVHLGATSETVARSFARALRAAGVRRVYGLPGEDHLRLLDAFAREDMPYIGAREESAAVMMAATEAQATSGIGVALVTIAPGLTNAINGIAHACLDGIPLLVVTGQHAPERAPLIVRQSLDNHRLVSGIAKWSVTASARIHQALAKAMDVALAPRRGPVLFELREDIASMQAADRAEDWPVLQSSAHTELLYGTAETSLVEHTRAATRPVIVVGGDCPTDARTRSAIGQAARCLRAPVLTSPSAMGVLGAYDPWLAGTFMNGNLESHILADSDLILVLGLDAKDFFNAPWRYTAPIVAINAHADTQRFVPVQHQLIGETAAIMSAFNAGGSSTWTCDDVAAYRQYVDDPFGLHEPSALTIASALRCAQSILPPETIVAVDAGFGKPLTSYLWSAAGPHQYFTAHGLSTMGYAIPAANALQVAFPDRPVVAFMGDGSLLMRASEITVAAEHGLAPVYVAWLDQSLTQIETKQERQQLVPVGTRLPRVSCAKIADAFGASGVDVESLDDFRQALESAVSARKPTLIGARIDQSRRAEWFDVLRG